MQQLSHLTEAFRFQAIGSETGAGVTPPPFAQAEFEGRRKDFRVRGWAARTRTSPARACPTEKKARGSSSGAKMGEEAAPSRGPEPSTRSTGGSGKGKGACKATTQEPSWLVSQDQTGWEELQDRSSEWREALAPQDD